MDEIVPSFDLTDIDLEAKWFWDESQKYIEQTYEFRTIKICKEVYGYKDAYFKTVVTKKFDGRRVKKRVLILIPDTQINTINFNITLSAIP